MKNIFQSAVLLFCSVVGTVLFTGTAGVWCVSRYVGRDLRPLLWEWQLPLLRVLAVMVPCWLLTEWFCKGAAVWVRLLANGSVLALAGAFAALRFGLPDGLALELLEKLPAPFRRPALFLTRCVRGWSYGGT